MEKEQIKIYCETMHKFYLDSANQSYKDYEVFQILGFLDSITSITHRKKTNRP